MVIDISRALSIDGWMSEVELTWLAQQARLYTPIVEVGSFIGRSTRALAQHAFGVVIAVDSWSQTWPETMGPVDSLAMELALRHPSPMLEFVENMRDLPNVMIHVGTLKEMWHVLCPGMVFIDGDHRGEYVTADIQAAVACITPGGLICGHDYGSDLWPDVTDAVREQFGMPEGVCEGIWWVRA
jgi:hypothetical protein